MDGAGLKPEALFSMAFGPAEEAVTKPSAGGEIFFFRPLKWAGDPLICPQPYRLSPAEAG